MEKLKTKESKIKSGFYQFSQRAKDFQRIQKRLQRELEIKPLIALELETMQKVIFSDYENEEEERLYENLAAQINQTIDLWEKNYKRDILILQFKEIYNYCTNNKLIDKMNIDDFRNYYLNNSKRFSQMSSNLNCEPNFGTTAINLQMILIDGIRALYCKHTLYYDLDGMEERHSITHLPLIK